MFLDNLSIADKRALEPLLHVPEIFSSNVLLSTESGMFHPDVRVYCYDSVEEMQARQFILKLGMFDFDSISKISFPHGHGVPNKDIATMYQKIVVECIPFMVRSNDEPCFDSREPLGKGYNYTVYELDDYHLSVNKIGNATIEYGEDFYNKVYIVILQLVKYHILLKKKEFLKDDE